MSGKLKNLITLSLLAFSLSSTFVAVAEAAQVKKTTTKTTVTTKKKTAQRASRAGVAANPGGIPKWVQYDNGGMYYYQKNELEKARQYWLEALRIAEGVVPRERAKGLSIKTENHCCDLITHLQMFVTDSKLNPRGVGGCNMQPKANGSYSDPRRAVYDNLAAQLRAMREDEKWFERIENFANRSIGHDNHCLDTMGELRKQQITQGMNIRYSMGRLENELKLSQSSIDNRPIQKNEQPSIAPNGEYIPPGQNN